MRYLLRIALICAALHTLGYIVFRVANAELYPEDNQICVIFPEGNLALWYLFRPLTYVDAAVTGMRFHIGPHRD
jgi:hypothetical protein